jgi:hypothetical protein
MLRPYSVPTVTGGVFMQQTSRAETSAAPHLSYRDLPRARLVRCVYGEVTQSLRLRV